VFPHGRRFPARSWVIALAGAAFLALVLAPVASTASARPSSIPNPSPIRHIVVLYLENHSFDSILGFWCDDHPGRCLLPGGANGGMPSSVKLSNGAVVTPTVGPDVVPNVDHSVAAQELAIDHGKMDGWWKITGCMPKTHYACISGYEPSQIPNATTLASDFAISDDTFSMKDSPSWGGHLYAVAANLDRFTGDNPVKAPNHAAHPGWGCDSDKLARWVSPKGVTKMIPSCVPDFSLGLNNGGAFRATPASYIPTIMDRLQAKGLTWKIYGQPTPPANAGGNAKGYIWDTCPTFAECLDSGQHKNNVPATQFVGDANAGKLANFSLVTPGGADAVNSEHNGFSMTAGDNWVGRIASAIMNGPEWKSTALFITWDDCGCFYDQVAPKNNPDGTPRGPRSPLIIVSPFAKPGFTDKTATTFAGILAFTEKNFRLNPLAKNDAKAYAFTNAFDFSQTHLGPVHMVTRPVPRGEHIDMSEADQDT
jgi:phospholipase C